MPQLGSRRPSPRLLVLPSLAAAALLASGCGGPAKSPAAPEPRVAEPVPEVVEPEVAAVSLDAPTAYVKLKTVTDRSEGHVSKKRRAARASDIRHLIAEALRSSPAVTMEATTGEDLGLRQFNVDATIEKLDRRVSGNFVEVACELRLSISDGSGRMLSFLTGGVAVQVPRHSFRLQYEPQLQREALEGAAKKIHRDLVAYLDRETRHTARVSRR